MLETIMQQAYEKGYRGRDALRASLGAYNCGWKSLEADRCFGFGGYAYADQVLNYWYHLLKGNQIEKTIVTFTNTDRLYPQFY